MAEEGDAQVVESIYIRGEGGGVFKLDLPLHETIEDQLRKGSAQRVDAEGNPYVREANEDQVPGLPGVRPAVNATKADWIGWAVANGETVDDASAKTKQDLIDLYGAEAEAAALKLAEEAEAAQAAADAAALAAAGGQHSAPPA